MPLECPNEVIYLAGSPCGGPSAQVHRALAMATGEHQNRFEIASTEIRDVVLVQVKIKPAWMVPECLSSRTVTDVQSEIRMQVRDIGSSLRRTMPSLFRMVEVGDDQASMHECETDSSSTASVGDGDSDTSGKEESDAVGVPDSEPLINFSTFSDEEGDSVEIQVAAPAAPARATRASASPAVVGALNANKSLSLSKDVAQLEGAELYSMARQSLACHGQKNKKSGHMFSLYMRCIGTKHYAARHLRKVMTAWHQLRQEGIGEELLD